VKLLSFWLESIILHNEITWTPISTGVQISAPTTNTQRMRGNIKRRHSHLKGTIMTTTTSQ